MYPTLFHIGNIPVRSFGLMVLLGFVLALWYAMAAARRNLEEMRVRGNESKTDGRADSRTRRRRGKAVDAAHASRLTPHASITPDHVFDMSLAALFVSIVGARILYVLLDLNEFRNNWWDVFKVWTGGISVHGAIVSGALFLWWYCRRHKLSFLEFGDICGPAFTLGYAVGRIGCFLNGCCYGKNGHPTQLYEMLALFGIFFLLKRIERRNPSPGTILLTYGLSYGVWRFLIEFLRGDNPPVAWGLTVFQLISLAGIAVTGPLLLARRLRARRD